MLSIYRVRKISSLLLSLVLMVTIGVNPIESYVNGFNSSSNLSSILSTSQQPQQQQVSSDNFVLEDDGFKITNQIKELLRERIDNNKTNAAIAIGLVDK